MISAIIPAYNPRASLPRRLDSVLSQTHENIEIVIIDDGEADETRELIASYAGAHKNIVSAYADTRK